MLKRCVYKIEPLRNEDGTRKSACRLKIARNENNGEADCPCDEYEVNECAYVVFKPFDMAKTLCYIKCKEKLENCECTKNCGVCNDFQRGRLDILSGEIIKEKNDN